MSERDQADFLILGQGLAGSLLAWQLMRRGRRVRVVDDGHRTAASAVAAGLVNPLAGLRFNPSPRAREWVEALTRLYDALAREAGRPFFHPGTMVRLFRSPEQIRFHQRRAARAEDRWLLGERFDPGGSGEPVHDPHGGFFQRHTGHLDLPALLGHLAARLEACGALHRQQVDLRGLEFTGDGVRLGALRARHLVCCEGFRMKDNPWFGHLPLAPDKGEFLVLEPASDADPARLPRRIVNGAHWLLRHADGRYRLGATHDHRRLDTAPTAEGRRRLLEGMAALLRHPEALQVVDQQAGVRPATADRRPLLGTHPARPRLHLFNGFGAHGSLCIPWYSERMAAWLLDGEPLPEEADIRRFRP